MKYVRIRSYLPNGTFTTCEHAYIGSDQSKALGRFRDEFPEHAKCILMAETIDDEDAEWLEWFKVARAFGCVHCF